MFREWLPEMLYVLGLLLAVAVVVYGLRFTDRVCTTTTSTVVTASGPVVVSETRCRR